MNFRGERIFFGDNIRRGKKNNFCEQGRECEKIIRFTM